MALKRQDPVPSDCARSSICQVLKNIQKEFDDSCNVHPGPHLTLSILALAGHCRQLSQRELWLDLQDPPHPCTRTQGRKEVSTRSFKVSEPGPFSLRLSKMISILICICKESVVSKPLIASLACSLSCKGELSRAVAPVISAEVVQPFVCF